MECVSENDVVCEDVQTPSVSSVEDSEERKEVSGGPGEQLEEDEDMQCLDGGSGRDGDDVDEENVDENEIGEEVSEDDESTRQHNISYCHVSMFLHKNSNLNLIS